MSIRDIFKNVFVINMDEHTDRMESFSNEMTRYGITSFERMPGVKINNGKTIKDRLDGNKESHYRCVRLAKERNLDYIVICEDDFIFDDRFMTKDILENIYKFINNELWDMFYFGVHYKQFPEKTNYEYVYKVLKGYAIHGYAVNARSYDFIIANYWSKEYDDMPGDVTYTNLIHPSMKSFAASPRIALQRDGFSYATQKDKNYNGVLRDISIDKRFCKENYKYYKR